jgi:hypothetical protein
MEFRHGIYYCLTWAPTLVHPFHILFGLQFSFTPFIPVTYKNVRSKYTEHRKQIRDGVCTVCKTRKAARDIFLQGKQLWAAGIELGEGGLIRY